MGKYIFLPELDGENFIWKFTVLDRIGASSDNNFSFEPQISARETSPGFDELNSQIEEARLQSLALEEKRKVTRDKLAKKEKKKDKKKKKSETNGTTVSSDSEYNSNSNMSEVAEAGATNGTSTIIPSEMLPSERVLEDEAKERQAEEERRKNREPPVVFTNIDVSICCVRVVSPAVSISCYFEIQILLIISISRR